MSFRLDRDIVLTFTRSNHAFVLSVRILHQQGVFYQHAVARQTSSTAADDRYKISMKAKLYRCRAFHVGVDGLRGFSVEERSRALLY